MTGGDRDFDGGLRAAAPHEAGPASPCPSDAMLASFYAGTLDLAEEDALREHLATCASCVARARDARAFVVAMGGTSRTAPGSRARWRLAVAAVLTAVALIAVWRATGRAPRPVAPPSSPATPAADRWRDLVVEKAPYVEDDADRIVWRGGGKPPERPAKGTFAWAMEPYVAGDAREAAARLERRVSAHPNEDRSRFYLGVARLLAGEVAASVEPLRAVAGARGALAGDASWYLALAHLKSGSEDLARPILLRLASEDGERGRRARGLLEKLEGPSAR